jgi:regulator of RNase E activity RraA
VPAALKDEVLEKARAVAGTENQVREAVRRGVAPLDAYDRFGKF